MANEKLFLFKLPDYLYFCELLSLLNEPNWNESNPISQVEQSVFSMSYSEWEMNRNNPVTAILSILTCCIFVKVPLNVCCKNLISFVNLHFSY